MPIRKLEPKCVWNNFYSLTQIPRPSGHTQKVAKFLVQWAKDRGMEAFQDECGNVIIRKPATPGMEDRKGIILQAHMDMVPQKNNDKKHDFTKDPIETRIVHQDDGDWVYACGTTLGADDGLGVAAAMSVLESETIKHGPLEALFTVDEETRMVGAKALKPGILKGDILLNLDSETEGELYVGCAGGIDANISFKYKEEPMPKGFKALKIVVTGLRGGHSGMEINEGRGNANKVMARLLLPILRDNKGKLASFNGGNMRNAIPREAEAVVAVPAEKVEAVKAGVEKTAATVKAELAPIDPGLVITVEGIRCGKVIAGNTGLKLVKALYACPNAVDRMSLEVEGLVETSNNLAIVHTDKGVINVNTLLRGSTDTLKMDLAESVRAAFELAGAKVWFDGAYSGWSPNMASPILHTMKDQYKKLFGKEPAVMAIHAGLECGILAGAYPNWDMISCGPTLKSPHSPDERCYVPSVAKWWQFIQAVIEDAPKK
ncbi:MAG: aminoacyl-histidine dipeptidase [Bacteroidales bacterium]|jgi:dipeptidase D|nr:aminoacyl-histidine dipeptidase [Bacteroidales bacterium]